MGTKLLDKTPITPRCGILFCKIQVMPVLPPMVQHPDFLLDSEEKNIIKLEILDQENHIQKRAKFKYPVQIHTKINHHLLWNKFKHLYLTPYTTGFQYQRMIKLRRRRPYLLVLFNFVPHVRKFYNPTTIKVLYSER